MSLEAWLEQQSHSGGGGGGRGGRQHASRVIATSHLLEAVKFIHTVGGSGVIHRDIKPANLLVNCRPGPEMDIIACALTDFGFTCAPGADHGSPGTTSYMSHELLKSAPYGQPADIWAVGVTLLECWTGLLTVFHDQSDQEVKERILNEYQPPERLGPAFDSSKARLDGLPYVQHHLQQCFLPQRDRVKIGELAQALHTDNEQFSSATR